MNRFRKALSLGAAAIVTCVLCSEVALANTSYTVRPGDTLWKLSREYHTTISKIKAMNGLHSDMIKIGQRLTLPGGANGNSVKRAAKLAASSHVKLSSRQSGVNFDNLSFSAPPSLIPVYEDAAQKYGVSWAVLAAIHKVESNFSISTDVYGPSGAEGPMQIMPSTFAIYGVAAPGHSTANVQNYEDAIYTTAHMLASLGFAKSPWNALYGYNHSVSYVDEILSMIGMQK